MNDKHQTLWQWLQAMPSLGAIFTAVADVSVETWLARWGIAFLVLQCAYLLWRWWRDLKRDALKRRAQLALETDDGDLD